MLGSDPRVRPGLCMRLQEESTAPPTTVVIGFENKTYGPGQSSEMESFG